MCFDPKRSLVACTGRIFFGSRAENRREFQNMSTYKRPGTIIYSPKLQIITFSYQFG